ncbi:MAG: hypothetical protein A4E52_00172 [Pelotomaculum sp. PtaB.Bin013]|nr:MAG: hypothetical protein A4E52_00172 [Pelotomaculum sp. PtaB.Bin013]
MVISFSPNLPEPSFAVAFTITVPFFTAVSKPAVLIVASPVPLVIDHVTLLFDALAGSTAADICRVPLFAEIVVVLPSPLTLMALTGTVTVPPPPPPLPPPPLAGVVGTKPVPALLLVAAVPLATAAPPPPVTPVTPLSTVIWVFEVSILVLSAPSFASTLAIFPLPVTTVSEAWVVTVLMVPATSMLVLDAP